jgi:MFS transporter, MHS family, proline/betaine transporter
MKPSIDNTRSLIRVGLIANVLEWYEFSIYGYLSPIMGQLFLPPTSPIHGLMQAWAIFALTYVFRPLGGIFWGCVGDIRGHGVALKASLLLMAIPTCLIGLLPTYNAIGALSIIGLMTLRFIQGFALGGEYPISACYVFEQAPVKLKSLLCSTVTVGSIIGLLLGSFTVSLLYWLLDVDTIMQGAWRIPYLLSIPMAIYILCIRQSITSPKDTLMQEISMIRSLSTQFYSFLRIIPSVLPLVLLVGFSEVCVYILVFWLPSYLTHFLHISPSVAQACNTFMLLVEIPLCLISGYLSGRFGYKRLLAFHTIAIILLSYPMFLGLQSTSISTLLAVHFIFVWLLSGIVTVMMEALGRSYTDTIRCLGMSTTNVLGVSLFGGTAPFICTWLINRTGLSLFPAYYMIAFGLIVLPIIWQLKPVED